MILMTVQNTRQCLWHWSAILASLVYVPNYMYILRLWGSLTWASVGAELWSGCGGWADDVLMVTFLSDRLLLSRLCDLCRSLPLRSLRDRDRHSDGGEGNAVAMVTWSRVREADWGHDNHCHHSSSSLTHAGFPLSFPCTYSSWSIWCKLG